MTIESRLEEVCKAIIKLSEQIGQLTPALERIAQGASQQTGGNGCVGRDAVTEDIDPAAAFISAESGKTATKGGKKTGATKACEEKKTESCANVTIEDLQKICLTIVKHDRSSQSKIRETISKFGAEKLSDVAETSFAALKEALEKLEQEVCL